MAHVSEEILERRSPPATDLDPSASVAVKRNVLRVKTPLKHVPVSPIFWRSPVSMFNLYASATAMRPFIKRFSKDLSVIPAIAAAKPTGTRIDAPEFLHNQEFSESFAEKIESLTSHKGILAQENEN